MTIQLGILLIIVLTFLGLVIRVKIQGARAETAEIKAKTATESLQSAERVIEQKTRTEQAVKVVQELRAEQHLAAQARIDAGRRDDFDMEGF